MLPNRHFAVASLSATLAMGFSHHAMATCVGSAGSTIVCTDESTIPFNNVVDFSSGPSNDNYAVKVMATPLTDGTATVTNSKTVSGTLNTLNATNTSYGIFGMRGADAFGIEEWNLINSGTISAIHQGLGLTAGVYLKDDAEAWNITNTGTISVTRGIVTSVSSGSTGTISATDAFDNSGTLNVAAAIYNNEEEIRDHNIINSGTISGTGQYSAGIFTRSNSFELVNNGTISGYEVAPDPSTHTAGTAGTAAAILTWDGRLLKNMPDAEKTVCNSTTNICTGREAGFGKSFIENNGAINGNVIITGVNGLQVMGRIGTNDDPNTLPNVNGALPNTNTPGGMVDRRDSEIENNGTIVGNFYYGNGSHVLNNTADGAIKGDIIVDMRRVTNYLDTGNYNSAASAKNDRPYSVYVAGRGAAFGEADEDDEGSGGEPPKIYTSSAGLSYAAAMADAAAKLVADNPDRHFTFENAGVFEGNINILTVNHQYTDATLLATAVPEVKITPQTVTLKPHITGSGSGSTLLAPSENSGFIDGKLFIGDGTMAGWTVTPAANDGSSSTISATAAPGKTKTTITPVIDSTVRNGETFLVARSLYGTALPGVEDDSFLVDWTAYQVGGAVNGNALAIQASVKDASDVAGISKPGASTLNGLIAAGGDGGPALGALGAAVQSLSDEDDVRKAGEQLSPETNFATQQAAITLNNAVGQRIDTRLNAVGATGAPQPYANGPYGLGMKPQQSDPNRSNLGGSLKDEQEFVAPRSTALWGQAFGAGMDQNERQNVDGYDARIYGLMVGYDNWISPGVRVGIAGGYANTTIDGKGDTRGNNTGIDSYLVEAYGAFKGSGWYASGRTGFTWHDYDTSRALTVPFGDSAKGSHDGDQFNASLEVGAPMAHGGTVLTPVASLTYSRLHQDGYTETSGSAMALDVGAQTNDSLVSGLGLKGLVAIANDTVIEGRALWLHEFSDDSQVVTAGFAAGGGTFTAAGPGVGRDSADLGIGMLAQIGFNSTFQLNYDANIREDYLAHVGSARIDINF